MKINKKQLALFLAVAALLAFTAVLSLGGGQNTSYDFLRVHIRANSNSAADQNVKYEVKEAVINYLTPKISECDTFGSAYGVLKSELKGIERVADGVLKQKGFAYASQAVLKQEEFPDRAYDGVVLPAGVYDALIINLGGGAGDNWWCVVYPPLCFASAEGADASGITYKSKIAELIDKLLGKK